MKKLIIGGGVAVAFLLALLLFVPVLVVASLGGSTTPDSGNTCAPIAGEINTNPNAGSGRTVNDLAKDWEQNARTIVGVGQQRGLSNQAAVVALATAMQESRLGNINYGDRDSVGLFQQRPSQGWGTVAQIMDPVYAAGKFYDALVKVQGWELMPVTVAAQRVQRSGFPGAYAQWETLSREIAKAGPSTSTPINAGPALGACQNGQNVGGITPTITGGWVRPNAGPWLSRYGMRVNPVSGVYKLHAGIDLSGPCGSPIYAAFTGVVTSAGPASGYGNLITVDHGNGLATRYAHMKRADILVQPGQTVQVGQQIAKVGTEGNSTGCHLHFETRQNGNPVDPEPILAAGGVKLEFRK